jgi:hypothetical protein
LTRIDLLDLAIGTNLPGSLLAIRANGLEGGAGWLGAQLWLFGGHDHQPTLGLLATGDIFGLAWWMTLAILWAGIADAATFIAWTEGRIGSRHTGATDQEPRSKEESCEGDANALSHDQQAISSVATCD